MKPLPLPGDFWEAVDRLRERLPFNDKCVTSLSISVGTEDPTLVDKLHRGYGGRLDPEDGDYVVFYSHDARCTLQVSFVGGEDDAPDSPEGSS